MTKYILHGGATRKPVESNKQFFREILARLPQKVKVLLVYFAREENEYEIKFEDDKHNFHSNSPDKIIDIEIANSDLEILRRQIANSDVIYVRGGNTQPLLEKMKQLPDFADLIKDKVYAGSSAGMYLVSKYYYSNDRKRIEHGLGILPIKVFAHWDESKLDKLKQLENFGEDLPIYKLAEGEYTVIEQ
ncbi:MAG: Type 1 glutamine amidotransferase-like domain-containing protein [Candidatus Doudnabacteria bacterium]|nr:Type 1 glutamine amidotransferase-like domain-containing protein [Candidatus Doudnabacteria bacterium]